MAASREELKTTGISPPSGIRASSIARQGSCAKMAHTLSNKTANFPGLARGMHMHEEKTRIDDRWPRNPHGVDLLKDIHTHDTYGRIEHIHKRNLTWFCASRWLLCELQWLSKRALFAGGGCAVSHSSDMNAEIITTLVAFANLFPNKARLYCIE